MSGNEQDKAQLGNLSKEEIAKMIKDGLPKLREVFSNMTGSRVNMPSDQGFIPVVAAIVSYANEWGKADFQNMPLDEKKKKINDLFTTILQVAGEGGNIGDPVGYLLNVYASPFAAPQENDFKKKTNFREYTEALFSIVEEVFLKNKRQQIQDIFTTMPDDDAYALLQGTIALNKQLPYLNISHNKITRQIVQKYIKIYDELAGHMEKMVMQLFAFKKVLEGETIDYPTLKKSKLNDYIESLLATSKFADLVKPMNVTIRNSIAHKRTIFQPLTRTVKFVDKKKSATLSYEDFVTQTRELAATDFVISHIENAMNLYFTRALKAHLGM